MRHTQDDLLLYLVNLKLDVNLRIIVIDFIIVKLIGVCSVIFPSRKRIFHVNIYVLVCYCYFELVILVILLFGTQQVVLELDWFSGYFFNVKYDEREGFAVIKVKLLQEERKLLNFGRAIPRGKKIVDGIWVKVEIVGRLPQIPIVIWKANWVSKLKKENLI